ncbi:MAG: hypothetical protein A3F47_02350 [Candidatus Staskawiczbacteria bacterium RIFCSPHIGHO2_12_FULL_38_11]|uniref:Uncharacterized protein n=1 Tax=Candidatus Staskawiczbacteria bacterium RIFCSPHIGHO2_12_FULL_38_11 TaxID=1802209 RepID=A0A1G2I5B1_9BACT|nr:MAG: hypothetical protein A3F47_02350 [Candidatus Staskawiczbacteria bacterium RIFCSPHIGHO2_12_FULL_38_11]
MKRKQLTLDQHLAFDQKRNSSVKFLGYWAFFMLLGLILGVGGAIIAAIQWSLWPLIPSVICIAIGEVFFVVFIRFRYHPKKLILQ